MKFNSCIIVILFCLIWACKKKEDLIEFSPKPEPNPTGMTKGREFLSGLAVTGSGRIQFDTISNSYLVNLPDNFNTENAEVKLRLQPGIFLVDSLGARSADTVIHYAYKGKSPLMFQVRDKTDKYNYYFYVYFNFTGTPDIELLQRVIPVSTHGVKLPIRLKGRVGSIPSGPNRSGIFVKIKNPKTGFSTEANIFDSNTTIGFSNAQQLITSDPFSLEVRVEEQKPVFFENVRFVRDLPIINTYPAYQFVYKSSDTIQFSGGYFLPEEKYTATFSNDFSTAAVSAQMQVLDSNRLAIPRIPATLAEGDYQLSVYEKDKLIGTDHVYISGAAERAIENIWQGEKSGSTWRNPNRIAVARGSIFFAKSWPLQFGYPQTTFDLAKIPRLRLASGSSSVELASELAVYDWGIAGVRLAFGQYKVPLNLQPGEYTVTGVFTDGFQTKPYWCRIQVK